MARSIVDKFCPVDVSYHATSDMDQAEGKGGKHCCSRSSVSFPICRRPLISIRRKPFL